MAQKGLLETPGALQKGPWRARLRAGEIIKMQLRHLGASWSTPCCQEAILKPFWVPIFESFLRPVRVQTRIKKRIVFLIVLGSVLGSKMWSKPSQKDPKMAFQSPEECQDELQVAVTWQFYRSTGTLQKPRILIGFWASKLSKSDSRDALRPHVATWSPQEATERTA